MPGLGGPCCCWSSACGRRQRPSRRRNGLHLTLKPFDRNFRLYLLALVVFTLGNSSDAFLLVRAGELGVPTVLLPVLWCLPSTSSRAPAICCSGVPWTASAPGPSFTWDGWSTPGFTWPSLWRPTAWEAWAFFLGYALFYGLTEPAEKTLVASLAGAERKGLAFGWYNFAIGVATLPASLIFGWLYHEYGPFVPFAWGAILALIAVCLLTGVKNRSEEAPSGK